MRAARAALAQSDFTERMYRGNAAPANERTDSLRLLSRAAGTAVEEAKCSVHQARHVSTKKDKGQECLGILGPVTLKPRAL